MKPNGYNIRFCPAFFCAAVLITSPLLVRLGTAYDLVRPCPNACECYKESQRDVNRIDCSKQGLAGVPDLRPLIGSSRPNVLKLNSNSIREISRRSFPRGMKIIELDLSHNYGLKISTNAFVYLRHDLRKLKLVAVDLSFDKPLDMLGYLRSLEDLNLDHNNRSPHAKGAVQNVNVTLLRGWIKDSLKKLSLQFCAIRSMSEDTLWGLTRLEELNLSNNYFQSIPSTMKHLSRLKLIECSFCGIKSLNDNVFSGHKYLETIDLTSNRDLTTVSDRAFLGCENTLKNLKLQRCALTSIPTNALRNLKKLTTLDISDNKFTDVPSKPLSGECKLTHLVIGSKGLKFNKDIFLGQEDNIVDLSIPHMDLETIPLEALKPLTKLNRLSLEYNKISVLPRRAFDGLRVQSIRLDNNPLSHVENGAFEGLPPNMTISLRQAKISNIDFLLDYPDGAINTVNFEHNNLVCGCSMKKVVRVTQTIRHVIGSCQIGHRSLQITSSNLGRIVDRACKEENMVPL